MIDMYVAGTFLGIMTERIDADKREAPKVAAKDRLKLRRHHAIQICIDCKQELSNRGKVCKPCKKKRQTLAHAAAAQATNAPEEANAEDLEEPEDIEDAQNHPDEDVVVKSVSEEAPPQMAPVIKPASETQATSKGEATTDRITAAAPAMKEVQGWDDSKIPQVRPCVECRDLEYRILTFVFVPMRSYRLTNEFACRQIYPLRSLTHRPRLLHQRHQRPADRLTNEIPGRHGAAVRLHLPRQSNSRSRLI